MLKRVIISCSVSLVVAAMTFAALVWMLYDDSFTSLAGVFSAVGIDPFSGSPAPLVCLGLASAVMFANVAQACLNRFWAPFFKVEAVAYFIVLLAVLFLKSQGVQEVNLNVGDVVEQVIEYPSSVLLNVALFVPLGGCLFTRAKSIPKAFVVALVFVLAVEALQYAFSLGIADVVDVLLNMVGFALGYLIPSLCSQEGVHLETGDRVGWLRFHLQGRDGSSGVSADGHAFARRVAVPVIGLMAVLGVLGFLAVSYYDYHSYEPWEDEIAASEDETLATLPEGAEAISAQEVLASLSSFSIDGNSSSSDWITAGDRGNQLQVSGVVQQYERWLDRDGEVRRGVVISVAQACNGVEVAHAIPLVLAPSTIVELGGEKIDLADEGQESWFEEQYSTAIAEASFTVQDGWLEACRVTLASEDAASGLNLDSVRYEAMIDFGNLTPDTLRANNAGSQWMDVRENETATVWGYLDSCVEMEGQESYFSFRVLDQLAGALISHEIRVHYDDVMPSIEDEDLVYREMPITLKEGQLYYAG